MVFHLGVMARLSCEDRLQEVANLSTVSGGSLCAGLVFTLNGLKWPDSREFLQKVEPAARQLVTRFDLQGSLIKRALGNFWSLFGTRADDLSRLIRDGWGVTGRLCDLPDRPRWMINATCYETGKNWRFEHARIGDYRFGYSNDTDVPLSDAMAASAGFPVLIGPLTLSTAGRSWFRYEDGREGVADLDQPERWKKVPIQPPYPEVTLWDGGVYDNHGLEAIFDYDKGWHERFGFLIVSDAAGRAEDAAYQRGLPALMRICTGIMMNQVRSLRTRSMMDRLLNHKEDRGSFLQMGNTCRKILKDSGHEDQVPQVCPETLSDEQIARIAATATMIRKLTPQEYEGLYRHGFEVADLTLNAYDPGEFRHYSYSNLPGPAA